MPAAQVRVRFRRQRRGWEVDGRAVGPGRRVFKDQEAAHEFARSLLQDTRRGVLPNVDRDVTLAAYAERWLQAVAPDLEAKTLDSYTRLLTAHVLPVLGAVRVRDLPRRDVRALLQAKRAARYSQNTVRLIRAALSSVLSDAEADDLIEMNPALRVGPKRGKRDAGQAPKADIRPMTWVQRDAFRAVTRAVPRYGALFEVMLLAGLRPGEALALQPGDLDFQAETIRVERALSGQATKDTKTHEARTVDMNVELVRALRQHAAWLSAETLRRGWGEPVWLFPSEANTPLDYANVAKAFKCLLKRAGLPAVRREAHLRQLAPLGERPAALRLAADGALEPGDDAPLLISRLKVRLLHGSPLWNRALPGSPGVPDSAVVPDSGSKTAAVVSSGSNASGFSTSTHRRSPVVTHLAERFRGRTPKCSDDASTRRCEDWASRLIVRGSPSSAGFVTRHVTRPRRASREWGRHVGPAAPSRSCRSRPALRGLPTDAASVAAPAGPQAKEIAQHVLLEPRDQIQDEAENRALGLHDEPEAVPDLRADQALDHSRPEPPADSEREEGSRR